jgi:hypothetical protein
MDTRIKMTFIHRAVEKYASDVVQAMQRSITKNNAIKTGALRDSLSASVNDNVGKLMFKEYGRFIDMGVGRGKNLSQVKQKQDKLTKGTRKLRKRKKIYSPIAYGKLNGLMGDIMYGLTEETIAAIKNELQNTAPTT